jgi:xanthine dehydrogenase accessory factor
VDEVLAIVSEILKKGEDLVLVRITSDKGPVPREAGARMIVFRDGNIIGTIGGGLVEATAIKKAEKVFEETCTVVFDINMNAKDAAGDGMICGGKIEVLCEYIFSDDDTVSVFDTVKAEHESCKRSVLCTEFEDRGNFLKTKNRFVIQSEIHDGSKKYPGLSEKLLEMSRSLSGFAMIEIENRKYLIDIVNSAASLFIFGAGHVGKQIAPLAVNLGFKTTVLDDRAEFANKERFPQSVEVVVLEKFENCFENLTIDENSYVVIVTRGHTHDKEVLGQALRTNAGYIGMIGSKRKRDTIYDALLSEGFSKKDLETVHCPIGLPIDCETPEEIAVSIVAELIDIRSGKRKCTRK